MADVDEHAHRERIRAEEIERDPELADLHEVERAADRRNAGVIRRSRRHFEELACPPLTS